MSKLHTFQEHIDDARDAYWNVRSSGNSDEANRIIWFTAYERWLNDRPLMREEDPSVLEWHR